MRSTRSFGALRDVDVNAHERGRATGPYSHRDAREVAERLDASPSSVDVAMLERSTFVNAEHASDHLVTCPCVPVNLDPFDDTRIGVVRSRCEARNAECQGDHHDASG